MGRLPEARLGRRHTRQRPVLKRGYQECPPASTAFYADLKTWWVAITDDYLGQGAKAIAEADWDERAPKDNARIAETETTPDVNSKLSISNTQLKVQLEQHLRGVATLQHSIDVHQDWLISLKETLYQRLLSQWATTFRAMQRA
ncbi:MAG: hypothetical protein EOO38_21070, partial [Cytophagaceae bacterium]